ncbi:glycosyltransferase [Adhaeribacter radiodurans]|uniref:Glycosyltransferase n=2 Tax=Adhaeribacter radiodurans TaxID=2745197 RepID=A0A7L7LFY8_9BACT|nr:glycosyltransferase [Adhaeribacter radiodurans]
MDRALLVSEKKTALPVLTEDRVYVKGKFLYKGKEKFFVKGVTYGTFKPQANGMQFPEESVVEKDFSMMAEQGINCVRTYTVPPAYLLNLALRYKLKVMVGLPWEQHIAFLSSKERKGDIVKRVQEGVLLCKQHPAILCFAIGNEIPANIVRWYGKKKVESFLKELYRIVKSVDPASLVTYVNFPTTEYLDLSFLDFDCFNVYLETPEKLNAYIAKLHNLSGDRPLVLAEIGLDSLRKGEEQQAETLTWQIQNVFAKGCAGMFVFAWTDEWWRGGFEIEDWDFGMVDRQRNPKPALYAVSNTLKAIPFATDAALPFISVVVCSYNGAATIEDTMIGLGKLDYPNYEVIVVNDGSTDNLANIVKKYPYQLITTENRGLSNARNTGLHAAKGEIVAYIDDDAYPDEHWLRYLAAAYLTSDHAGMGGPNIAPDEDGPIAKCVANAPGGPVHVLLSEEAAEHIPGCNMSFRRSALLEIGGFDPLYRSAGDDVDVCWRIQKAGYTIGFHPSAVVWHHRRNSLKAYWKQQQGYGKAEALLEAKWPEKYNEFGHLAWAGRIYGNGFTLPIKTKKDKIFHGTWGTALFQSVYQPADGLLNSIPLMPEWYLFSGFLAFLASLGWLWSPLLWVWPVFLASILIMLVQAAISASKNVSQQIAKKQNVKYQLLITLLHVIQPIARLYGRLKHGLTPWRLRGDFYTSPYAFVLKAKQFTLWSEKWRSAEEWLEETEQNLIKMKARVQRGGNFDKWDIRVRNSIFSSSKGLFTFEEHGAGKQLLRFKAWPIPSKTLALALLLITATAALAALDNAIQVTVILFMLDILLIAAYCKDSASTISDMYEAFNRLSNTYKIDPKVIGIAQMEGSEQPENEAVPVSKDALEIAPHEKDLEEVPLNKSA